MQGIASACFQSDNSTCHSLPKLWAGFSTNYMSVYVFILFFHPSSYFLHKTKFNCSTQCHGWNAHQRSSRKVENVITVLRCQINESVWHSYLLELLLVHMIQRQRMWSDKSKFRYYDAFWSWCAIRTDTVSKKISTYRVYNIVHWKDLIINQQFCTNTVE